jgi:hypothetical protein
MAHKKGGKRYTIRYKGRCSCGMKKHSLRTLSEHSKAKGHTVVRLPRVSSCRRD